MKENNKQKKQKYILDSLMYMFRSVESLSHVRLFATPWIAAHQASLSITNSRSSLKLMSIELVLPSSHLGNNLVIALKVTYMLNHLQFYQNYFFFNLILFLNFT